VPCLDEKRFLKMRTLKGAQTGRSGEAVLNKRAQYRAAFDDGEKEMIALPASSAVRGGAAAAQDFLGSGPAWTATGSC